jgi:serine/threonine-protein kinase
MTRDPVSVSRRRPDVPPALAALVMKCLAKMPEQRPQAATELVAELDAMATGSGDFAPSAIPARRWGALLGALAVAVVAIVLVRSNRSGGGPAAAKPDSAVAPTPASPAPATTPSLTRAESLAIADAVERRMANRTSTAPAAVKIDSATLAAIRLDVEKSVLDSLQKMRPSEPAPGTRGTQRIGVRGPDYSGMTQAHIDSIVRSARGATDFARGFPGRATPGTFTIPPRGSAERALFDARMANMGPPRRVVVADPPQDRQHPALQAAGTQVMDALRKQLGGNPRYVLVNRDSTAAALQRTRGRDSVMHLLGADMNVSIRAMPTAGADSVRWRITLFDPTSQMLVEVVNLGPVPANVAPALTDSLARAAVRALWQLDHTPRRGSVTPPATPPATPAPPAPQAAPVKKP